MNASISQKIKHKEFIKNKLCFISITKREISKISGETLFYILSYISKKINADLKVSAEVYSEMQEVVVLAERKSIVLEELLDVVVKDKNLNYHFDGNSLSITKNVEDAPELEMYDVQELVFIDEEFSEMTEDEYDDEHYEVFGLDFENIAKKSHSYTESGIANLVKQTILKDDLRNFPLTFISSKRGKLSILHYPNVHKKINCFLENLKELSKYKISITPNIILYKSNFLKQTKLEFNPIYPKNENSNIIALSCELSEKQEENFVASLQGSNDASVFEQEPIICRQLESKYFTKYNRTHFLSGQEKTGRMYEGIIVKATPNLDLEKQKVQMEIEVTVAVIMKPVSSFPVCEGEIAVPYQLTQKVHASVEAPLGKGLLVGGFLNPYEEGEKSFMPNRKKENLMLYFKTHIN